MSKRKGLESESAPAAGMVAPNSKNVKDTIALLLDQRNEVSSGTVAASTGVTRQAAHYHLAAMVRAGELERVGRGRGARYRRRNRFERVYATSGLAEDRAWDEVVEATPEMHALAENVRTNLHYSMTEMINNAIDHADSPRVRVWVAVPGRSVVFGVSDEGVGVFARVREWLGLEDEFAALQQLSKGKVTSDPERHTGEGIFFTSKVLDVFTLEGNGLRWVVDNLRDDQAVGDVPIRPGTRVTGEMKQDSSRTLAEVFSRHTKPEELSFSKTTLSIPLFAAKTRFISRSEAKRLIAGLERFEEVTLDFKGVEEVGQGFVDELFRVWARAHPATRLVPINASPGVRIMMERGLPSS